MGTRSLTVIMDDEFELCTMYRQCDGYPDGHGKELADFLGQFTMTNGIPCGGDENIKYANGAGCLTAFMFSHFKEDAGNIYLYPSGSRDCGEEYIYTVTIKSDEKRNPLPPVVTVYDCYEGTDLFSGSIDAMKKWIVSLNEE